MPFKSFSLKPKLKEEKKNPWKNRQVIISAYRWKSNLNPVKVLKPSHIP